ncbi:MAG: HutD/Ves family protein [Caldimonas sp.]
MMSVLVRGDDVRAAPWRNGAGTTRELLALPGPADWRVRVSVADVASAAPFSSFPGVERWFAVLDGPGVELTIEGTTHRCTPSDAPLRFSGAATTSCQPIDGPTRDLNLMLRGAAGVMHRVVAAAPWRPDAQQCGLYAVVAGRCRHDDGTVEVPAHSLLWFEPAPDTLAFFPAEKTPGAIGWWLAATVEERAS